MRSGTYQQLEREAGEYVVGYTEQEDLVLGMRDATGGLGFVTTDYNSRFDIVRTEPLDLSRPDHAHFVADIDRLNGRDPDEAAAKREAMRKEDEDQEALRQERNKKLNEESAAEAAKREESEQQLAEFSKKLVQYQTAACTKYSAVREFWRGLGITQLLFLLPMLWWPAMLYINTRYNFGDVDYGNMRHDIRLLFSYAPLITVVYAFLFWSLANHRRKHPISTIHNRQYMPRNSLWNILKMVAFALLVHLQLTVLCSFFLLMLFGWVFSPLDFWHALAHGYFGFGVEPVAVAVVFTVIYLRLYTKQYRPAPFYPVSPQGALPGTQILVLAVGFALYQWLSFTSGAHFYKQYTGTLLLGTVVLAVVVLWRDWGTFKLHRRQAKILELNDANEQNVVQLARPYVYAFSDDICLATDAFMARGLPFTEHFAALARGNSGWSTEQARVRLLEPLRLATS